MVQEASKQPGDLPAAGRHSTDKSRTRDNFLEILFLDKNQVDGKIACGLAEGFLFSHSSFIC